jgi:hypothetical protein
VKFRSIQNAFSAGVLSPKLFGRTDLPQYKQGCAEMLNMIPLKQGGAQRRPGTEYLGESAIDGWAELIPFVYSESSSYMLELSNEVAGGIQVWDTNALNNPSHTGTHSYSATDLKQIKYTQSADVLFMVQANQKPLRTSRISASSFATTAFDNGLTGQTLANAYPYRTANISAITLTPSGTSGSITLTASASLFDADHVGALFKMLNAATWGAVKITAVTNATTATATVVVDLGGTGATAQWAESAWSDYRGWPRTVALYQGRIAYGGCKDSPDTIWYSATNNFDQLSLTNPADDLPEGSEPFEDAPNANQVNEIQWMTNNNNLLVGTLGEEFIVRPTDGASAFANGNTSMVSYTSIGSAYLPAERNDHTTLFIERDYLTVREMFFDFNYDSYVTEDLSILNNDIVVPVPGGAYGIARVAFDKTRSTLWCVDTAGQLFGLTRSKQAQVAAWHQHELGGTDVVIHSIATVPNSLTRADDLWMCVSRTIDSDTVYYIERMGTNKYEDLSSLSSFYGPFTSDCSILDTPTAWPAAGTSFTSFTHLPEETVSVIGDGWPLPNTTVSAAGEITAPIAVKAIIAGLPFTSRLKTLRLEAGSQLSTAQHATKRIHKAWVRFYNTVGAKIGRSLTDLKPIVFRSPTQPMNEPIEPFSGDKELVFPTGYDEDAYVYIVQEQPLPMTVCSITTEGVTYD